MKQQQQTINPQDIVILLKLTTLNDKVWYQKELAEELVISQSEISKSLLRSKFANLIDQKGKKVRKKSLLELLQHGIAYVFPQRPGGITRGIPTAHSAPPLSEMINSTEHYVWSSAKGTVRGQSIIPLYPTVVDAALNDPKLHELLALVDALRVGRVREKNIAIEELKTRLFDDK